MSILSAIVVYAVLWFMVMFIVLPFKSRSQAEENEIVPGTHAGAPANFQLKTTMWLVTFITTPLYALIIGTIMYSGITIKDIDFFDRMGSSSSDGTGG
jgi:predicted secreted protein